MLTDAIHLPFQNLIYKVREVTSTIMNYMKILAANANWLELVFLLHQ